MLARLARVLLVLALLAAWQAALEHPIAHVDDLGEFVHLHGGPSDEGEPLCDQLAALTACAAQAVPLPGQPAVQTQIALPTLDTLRVADAPPFLSQAPPASA